MSQSELKELWDVVQEEAITKFTDILDGDQPPGSRAIDYPLIHGTLYKICADPKLNYSRSLLLYAYYWASLKAYITCKVLPSLRETQDDALLLLREFVHRWNNHKVIVSWVDALFSKFDSCCNYRKLLPCLRVVGRKSFVYLVYREVKGKVGEAVILMMNKERGGEGIDQELVKKVLDILVEIGEEGSCAVNDSEAATLRSTVACYSGLLENSRPVCSEQIDELCRRVRDMAARELPSISLDNIGQQLQDLTL